MVDTSTTDDATTDRCLRIAGPFHDGEVGQVVDRIATRLDRQIGRWSQDQVELELSAKDRESPEPKVTLEAWVTSHTRTHFVATSHLVDLTAAVDDVATDVARQVKRYVDKRITARRR